MNTIEAETVASHLREVPEIADEARKTLHEHTDDREYGERQLDHITESAVSILDMLEDRTGEILYRESSMETVGDQDFDTYVRRIASEVLEADKWMERCRERYDRGFERETVEFNRTWEYVDNLFEYYGIEIPE